MPSFFSRKSRSQAYEGQGQGQSQGLPAEPVPPGVSDPYQLHLQQQQKQQQQPQSLDQTRRPSLAVHAHGHVLAGHLQAQQNFSLSTDNLNSPATDLFYDDIPPDHQLHQLQQHQQHQQQQHHRHPAHRGHPPANSAATTTAGDRPTISLVGPANPGPLDAANYRQNNSTSDLDRSSVEQPYASSSQDFIEKPSKLHKKKGFFSRHQSTASTSQGKPLGKPDSSLGRSVSFKHKLGGSVSQHNPQQNSHQKPLSEEPVLGRLQTTQPSTLQQQQLDHDATTPTGEPPGSPSAHAPSSPQTPIDRPPFGHAQDQSYHLFQHHRTGSADSFPSQASSRRPSAQQPAQTQLTAGDMAAIDRAGVARQADSQSQLPSRKDSLAAQGTQSQSPYSNVPQGSSFKTNISQQNLADPTGRETPPAISASSKLQEELENIDVAAVLQRHEELQAKYIKVKKYYFEKEAQVTQLQNTVAHQRMAVSRTVLDDNEYAARFSRLDGAIKELSFSIRKDWKTVPDWLHSYVNEDAAAVGTKEMTGVGRAVISRWIAEEIFERYFHPGLERTFSERLKTIESNLRRQQVQAITDDDKENQVARISNWRRTTLDGLSDILQSPIMQENQAQLADYLVEKLSATLQCDLKEPSPPELTHGARTIIQNAINIIEKIPQEARDIVVDYIVPGLPVSENTMKIETGLPPLTRPISGEMPPTDRGRDSTDDMEVEKDLSNNSQGDRRSSPTPTHIPQNREQRKKYPFGNLMSKKSMASSTTNPTQSTSSSPSDSRPGNNSDGTTASKDRDEQLSRVRFATFMTVEVRGRGPNNVLIQAPVYTVESS